ncbi:MAG: DNA-binding protein [Candidatus Auribacter fodinae]|jgi:abortive infection bacteriophage resistance protein|uniref:DNA-binding protein n=1 Tax=Candidatus Auribacter fodinae TaxID=2093366 RepID=A0A3A4R5B1_9BACT|nr:MAG: DNA-binding protein [Candidatus Auribacter fodinae]
MRYNKRPLTFEEQADLLLSRGLQADRERLITTLQNVNYYRLSGYLYPYRQPDDTFKKDTTFQTVWRHYTFDRRLRLIVMDAIERVEISVRTQLIYILTHKTGAFGYAQSKNFPGLNKLDHSRLIDTIKHEVARSKETFVIHFQQKYGDTHNVLPMWMSGEIMSFGCTLTIYNGVSDDIKKAVASYYKVPEKVLTSWLKTLNVIRNICAHHSRLWNRVLGVKPLIPRKNKYPEWHEPVQITQERVFSILTIFSYLLEIIAPHTRWRNRLMDLFDEYPEISRLNMGFPEGWTDSVFWKSKS